MRWGSGGGGVVQGRGGAAAGTNYPLLGPHCPLSQEMTGGCDRQVLLGEDNIDENDEYRTRVTCTRSSYCATSCVLTATATVSSISREFAISSMSASVR